MKEVRDLAAEVRGLGRRLKEESDVRKTAYEVERAEKARILEDVVKDLLKSGALIATSSLLPKVFWPSGGAIRGLSVTGGKDPGSHLLLLEDGKWALTKRRADGSSIVSLTSAFEIVASFSIFEVLEELAMEFEAQIVGQKKASSKSAEITRRLSAIATLLEGVR